MATIDQTADDIETAIILALSGTTDGNGWEKIKRTRGRKSTREEISLDHFAGPARFPKSFYAFDLADSENRLFSYTKADLVTNPYLVCLNGLETGMLTEDGSFKWTGIFPMPKPKGVVAVTNQPFNWFSLHYRNVRPRGAEEYVRLPLPISAKGDVCLMKVMGDWKGHNAIGERGRAQQHLNLAVSMFEDATRKGAYLATVKEHVEMKFPVGDDAYKAFFAMRDGHKNTPTGRRNPIIHWTAEHIRCRGAGNVSRVSRHKRGAQEMVHGNLKLSIEENSGYEQFLGDGLGQ